MENNKAISIFIGIGILISGCSSPTIQKKINVTEQISSGQMIEYIGPLYYCNFLGECGKDGSILNTKSLTQECLKFSISERTLEQALAKGARVITSTTWSQPVQYQFYGEDGTPNQGTNPPFDDRYENGTCAGMSYILDGPKAVLDKI